MMKQNKGGDRTYHIGVLMGNMHTIHPQELLCGIYAAAAEYPVNLEIFPGMQSNGFYHDLTNAVVSNEFEYQFNTIYDFALFGDLDALIISYGTLSIFLNETEQENFFQKFAAIPYVVLEEREEAENVSYIISDNYNGMSGMMEHLITDHGYRKILYISGPRGNTDADERRKAYLDAMERHGLPVEESMILYGDYTEYIVKEVEALLDANPDAEAVCAANDSMAAGVYKVCQKRGLRVGRDIAVTGYDNTGMSASMMPPLSTVEQNGYDMGYMALVKAISLCEINLGEGYQLPARPILRQSCGCRPDSGREETALDMASGSSHAVEIADRMLKDILLSSFDVGTFSYMKRHLTKIVSYIIEEIYLSEEQTDMAGTYEHLQYLMQEFAKELVQSGRTTGISLRGAVEQMNDFVLQLVESEPDMGRKTRLVRLMKFFNEYVLRAYHHFQTESKVDQNRMLWLGPLHVREMIGYGCREKEVYQEAVLGMRRQNIKSSYILLYREPLQYNRGEEWSCPEKLYLAAYQNEHEIRAYEPEERPVFTKERGFSSLFEGKGHAYVAYSLVFHQEQYGILLCEISSRDISSTYVVSLEMATGIYLLEMSKKEYEAQRMLQETMNELQAKNQILQFVSQTDALTGLLNRRGLVEKLILKMRERAGSKAYMLFADLDHLKEINDTFGHGEGDFAIRQIGEVLRQETGEEALVARLGGDEFVAVIFPHEELDRYGYAERIHQECSRRNTGSDKSFFVECSLGILEFTCDPLLEIAPLLEQADSVMYEAKKNRRTTVIKEFS